MKGGRSFALPPLVGLWPRLLDGDVERHAGE
jgi:hypothetical protein